MIPKIIHHNIKKNNMISTSQGKLESWFKYFPISEYKHMIWNEEKNIELLKDEFDFFSEIYQNHLSDNDRYKIMPIFYMYKYGGIYTHDNVVCKKNFYDQINDKKISILKPRFYKSKTFCSSFSLIASVPREQIWKNIMDEIYERKINLSSKNNSLLFLGKNIYDDVTKKENYDINRLTRDFNDEKYVKFIENKNNIQCYNNKLIIYAIIAIFVTICIYYF